MSGAGRPTAWIYKIRRSGKGSTINVPAEVTSQLPEGLHFELKITTEGLLYAPVTNVTSPEAVQIPWATSLKEAS